MNYPKRLIEVDLPIKRISEHARREKSIRHGHISTLHIWWARRPLAACRAVLCASLWPDPADSLCPKKFLEIVKQEMLRWAENDRLDLLSKESVTHFIRLNHDNTLIENKEFIRELLLDFIADFSNWDNSNNKHFLETSKRLTHIAHVSLGGVLDTKPLVVDPFAGGGSIPLEALRVGSESFGSDLNPIPVLLNKVLLEYIPKFGQKLSEEIRNWGAIIKHQLEVALSKYYPKEKVGDSPVVYLWARTIKCEGPNCGTEIPLIRSLWLSKRQSVGLTINSDHINKKIRFSISHNSTEKSLQNGTIKRGTVTCPLCGFTTSRQNVENQVKERSVDPTLLAVVIESNGGGKRYRLPTEKDYQAIKLAKLAIEQPGIKEWIPTEELPYLRSIFNVHVYGINKWSLLFDPRQQLAMVTMVKAVNAVARRLNTENKEMAQAISVCLALAVDRLADFNSNIARWANHRETSAATFGRQALGMVWDYCETVPISDSTGSFSGSIEWVCRVCDNLSLSNLSQGTAVQASAANHPLPNDSASLVFTDPPYYDAVPYANLADFFYIWLKRSIGDIYPDLFFENETPKNGEAVQLAERNKAYSYKTKEYFEDLMAKSFENSRRYVMPDGLGVIVFAHKSTSAWETLLSAVITSGWVITASWPIDTEMANRLRAHKSASLSSSVHLVCRPRENSDGSLIDNNIGDWREVLKELPVKIKNWMPRLAKEGIVGADAIFACIGPALEVFSKYSSVEKANGDIVALNEYLEQVWAAVSQEALSMVIKDADAKIFEEDARITAMWLWTVAAGQVDNISLEEDEEEDDEEEAKSKNKPSGGFTLEYDTARLISMGLGASLSELEKIIEVKGDKARLLPVAERTVYLFGSDGLKQQPVKKKKKIQASLFSNVVEEPQAVYEMPELKIEQAGKTVLDRLHQAMLLFATTRTEALKRFLVEDGIGKDERFWKLAQALTALYPKDTDERRWVEAVQTYKKSLGF